MKSEMLTADHEMKKIKPVFEMLLPLRSMARCFGSLRMRGCLRAGGWDEKDIDAAPSKAMQTAKLIGTKCCLALLLITYGASSFSKELKPIWLTNACYQLRLSVNDKLSVREIYTAKYVVKATDGKTYVAERSATAKDITSSEVIFPDGFKEEKTSLQAYADCHYGKQYTWEIYVDGALIDSGTIGFTRSKRH